QSSRAPRAWCPAGVSAGTECAQNRPGTHRMGGFRVLHRGTSLAITPWGTKKSGGERVAPAPQGEAPIAIGVRRVVPLRGLTALVMSKDLPGRFPRRNGWNRRPRSLARKDTPFYRPEGAEGTGTRR